MSDLERRVDEVLETLVRDVSTSIHSFYRGELRQETTRVKTETFRKTARDALLAVVGVEKPAGDARPSQATVSVLAPDEVAAITRCITAWLPMGPPPSASPQSRCVPAAKEVLPTWGEREKARLAIRRASG